MNNMEKLKKTIINNLYSSNFLEALTNIKNLENDFKNINDSLFLYYYLYDLLSWVGQHKECKSLAEIEQNKVKYFEKILRVYDGNKSYAYLELYVFLDENFRNFNYASWFDKDNKSKELLKQSLEENPNNKKAQFYSLFCEEKIKECFEFLNKNELNIQIVQKFLNSIWHKKEFLDDSQKLKERYNLTSEQSDLYYYVQKKDYKWLYKYFNNNEQRKSDSTYIDYGKVCFEYKKYDEAISYYSKKEVKIDKDYFILGECYEKKAINANAIECYKEYYTIAPLDAFGKGFKKLFELKEYDLIDSILKIKKSGVDRDNTTFYEAKLLSKRKEYKKSIELLSFVVDKLASYNKKELKKDIYFLYIVNNYKITKNIILESYERIIKEKDFEYDDIFGLNYTILSSFQEMQKYIKKLNIEYDSTFYDETSLYEEKIKKLYIIKIKQIYKEFKKSNLKISEDRELYYLSAFKDEKSIKKRITIFKNKMKNDSENPIFYFELGKLYYQKSKKTAQKFKTATKYLNKSIKLSDKYFVNLGGQAELLLLKIKNSEQKKRKLFDKSIKDFIFYNSYQKDTRTTYFLQTLFKYQSFSINSLSSLSENYLYFANPEQLNDPFDVASESLEKQFKNLKLNKSDFKLCSLSQINNNKLMWAHYTNEHTGICVGYKFLYLPNYVGKSEVKYKNTNLNEKEIFNNILEYWIVKSEDWEYEKEVRLLHYGEKQKIHYTFDVDEAINKKIIALKIESITLGLKFKNKDILKPIILEIERKQDKKIQIFEANMIEQKLIIEKTII